MLLVLTTGNSLTYTIQKEPKIDLLAVVFCPAPSNKIGKIYSFTQITMVGKVLYSLAYDCFDQSPKV